MTEADVPDRTLRAINEYHSVIHEGEDLFTVVSESGSEYTVDLREPACTCPDFEYRDEVEACKHIRRARLEAGEIEPETVAERLASSAEEIEGEAEQLDEQAAELRDTARTLRRTLDRLREVAEE